jgi:hypothetical protein
LRRVVVQLVANDLGLRAQRPRGERSNAVTSQRRSSLAAALTVLASLAALPSCGSRSPYWDTSVDTSQTPYGLARGIAIVDDANHQLVAVTSAADHTLQSHRLPIGHHFASATPTADGESLLLLSSGDWPLVNASDDPPSLTMLTIDGTFTASTKRFAMSEPLGTLAVDPYLEYAVAYQGSTTNPSFATNPNQLIIFDLTKPPGGSNPKSRTLQSFGGSPQRLTFSPSLMLPADAASAGVTATSRRLLIVETTIDVAIVDLTNAFADDPPPDITIPLGNGTGANMLSPAAVTIDPNPDDGRIAFRTVQDHNVYTMQLVPAQPAAAGATAPRNDFTPSINLTDVGGNPSDIAFVNTLEGLRVAALVPATSQAVLVEPDTSVTTAVALAFPYSNLSLVTSIVNGPAPPSSPDVAMLWQQASNGAGGTAGVALWTLGDAVGQPYRSVDVLTVEDPISSVVDVPSSNLKILTTPSGSAHALYVLDLASQTTSPIDTTTEPTLALAPYDSTGADGGRFWAYASRGTDLAYIGLKTLNPIPLTTTAPIASVFDIAAEGGAARTLIAIHAEGTFGATVFDALKPQTATSYRDVALLLEQP